MSACNRMACEFHRAIVKTWNWERSQYCRACWLAALDGYEADALSLRASNIESASIMVREEGRRFRAAKRGAHLRLNG